jgi:hypothetical protein
MAVNHNVRMKTAIVSKLDMLADHAKRSDRAARSDLRPGMDD